MFEVEKLFLNIGLRSKISFLLQTDQSCLEPLKHYLLIPISLTAALVKVLNEELSEMRMIQLS